MSTPGAPLGGPLGDALAAAEPLAAQQLQQLAAPAANAAAKAAELQAQAEQAATASGAAEAATANATSEIASAFSSATPVETPGVPCACGSHVAPAFDRAVAQQDIVDALGSSIKANPLRQEYQDKVAALSTYAGQIEPDMSDDRLEALAQQANQARRDLGTEYKALTPGPLLDYIKDVNTERYGDPLGPTVKFLVDKGREYEDIIKSASRPNPDIDKLLSGFGDWLASKPDDYIKQCLPQIGK